MASFVATGAAANGSNSAGPLTPGLPAGWAPGDLLVVQFQCFGGTNSRVPSMDGSWAGGTWLNGTASHGLWWKMAESGEGTPSITLTGSGATSDTQVSRCHAFRPTSGYEFVLEAESATHTNASADNIGTIAGLAAGDCPSGALLVLSGGKTNDWNGTATLTGWTGATQSESTTGNDASACLLYILSSDGSARQNVTIVDNGATASTGAGSAKMVSFVEVLATFEVVLPTIASGAALTAPTVVPAGWSIAQHKRTNQNQGEVATVVVTLDSAVSVGQYIDLAVTWANSADEGCTAADNLGGGTPNVYTEQTACRLRDIPDGQLTTRFTCPVTQAGTPTITVTFAGTRAWRAVEAIVIDGAASVDKTTGAVVTGTAQSSGSVTPDTDGELCLSVTEDTSNGVNTITPEGTVILNNGATDGYCSQYEVQGTAGAIAGDFTYASSGIGQTSIITYRPSGGGGGGPAVPALLPSSGLAGGMRVLGGGIR